MRSQIVGARLVDKKTFDEKGGIEDRRNFRVADSKGVWIYYRRTK